MINTSLSISCSCISNISIAFYQHQINEVDDIFNPLTHRLFCQMLCLSIHSCELIITLGFWAYDCIFLEWFNWYKSEGPNLINSNKTSRIFRLYIFSVYAKGFIFWIPHWQLSHFTHSSWYLDWLQAFLNILKTPLVWRKGPFLTVSFLLTITYRWWLLKKKTWPEMTFQRSDVFWRKY